MVDLAIIIIVMLVAPLLPPPEKPREPETFKVTASWYSHSGKMADTRTDRYFDPNDKHLAAHKDLPFGTKLRLTNPANQQTLEVEIADRGPYVKGRDLDLSRAGALHLGFKEEGVTDLRAQVIEVPAS